MQGSFMEKTVMLLGVFSMPNISAYLNSVADYMLWQAEKILIQKMFCLRFIKMISQNILHPN